MKTVRQGRLQASFCTAVVHRAVLIVLHVLQNISMSTKITGVKSALTLKKGAKTTLKPVRTPFTSGEKITYTSSNKNVATVSSTGVITAKKAGTAVITVKSGSKKVTCKVTVK